MAFITSEVQDGRIILKSIDLFFKVNKSDKIIKPNHRLVKV